MTYGYRTERRGWCPELLTLARASLGMEKSKPGAKTHPEEFIRTVTLDTSHLATGIDKNECGSDDGRPDITVFRRWHTERKPRERCQPPLVRAAVDLTDVAFELEAGCTVRQLEYE